MNIIIYSFILSCMLISSLFAQGSWTQGRMDPVGGSDQYIGIDPQGILLLNPVKSLDETRNMGKGIRICNYASAPYHLLSQPYFDESSLGKSVSFVRQGGQNRSLVRVPVDNNLKCLSEQSLNLGLSDAWVHSAKGFYYQKSGVLYATTTNADPGANVRPVNWETRSFSRLFADSLSLFGVNQNGLLWGCAETSLGVLEKCELIISTPSAVPSKGLMELAHSGSQHILAMISEDDSLRYWNGTWRTVPEVTFDHASSLRMLLDSTGLIAIQVVRGTDQLTTIAVNGSQVWQSWTYGYSGEWVRDRLGNVVLATQVELGRSPSFFARVREYVNGIWGFFFHAVGIAIEDLLVQPNPFSEIVHKKQLVQYRIVGEAQASVSLGVYKDSTGGVPLLTLLDSVQNPVGLNSLYWSNSSLADGAYYLGLRAKSKTDSVWEWKRIVLDKTPPQGSLNAVLEVQDAVKPFVDQNTILAAPMHAVRLNLDSVVEKPFADSGFWFDITLRHRETGVKQIWSHRYDPADSSTHYLMLDGSSPQGVALSRGVYSLQWTLRDIAGNTSDTASALKVLVSGKLVTIDSLLVDRLDLTLAGNVSPIILDKTSKYHATVSLKAVGTPGDSLMGAWNIAGGLDSSIFKLILNEEGRWDTAWTDSFYPGSKGINRGVNELEVSVANTKGLNQKARFPFVVDSMETVITAPSAKGVYYGAVPVYGVASAARLNQGSGFGFYRAYWVEGAVDVPEGLSKSNLRKLAEWKPMKVPLVAQVRSLPAGVLQPSIDALYPESNIGFVERTSEGLLAYFSADSQYAAGKMTVLIISEESQGEGFSYDAQTFNWGGYKTENPSQSELLIADSNGWVLDLTDSNKKNDSLVFGIRLTEFNASLSLLLANENGAQKMRSGIVLSNGKAERWVFHGKDASGALLPNGKYLLTLEGFQSEQSRHYFVQKTLEVKRSSVVDSSRVLNLLPDTLYYVPGLPQTPVIGIQLQLDTLHSVDVRIFDEFGELVTVLADSQEMQKNTLVWDCKDQDGNFLLGNDSIRFFDVQISYDGVVLQKRATVIASGKLLDYSMLLQVDSATSSFKFRARPKGVLSYFPVRRVDYSPRASGQQVLRIFKSVPWSVDYLKFYNSVELIAEADYDFKGSGWKTWHRHSTIEAPGQFNTFYNLNPTLLPTSLESDNLGSSWMQGDTTYFGDRSYFVDGDQQDGVTHECSYKQTWRDSTYYPDLNTFKTEFNIFESYVDTWHEAFFKVRTKCYVFSEGGAVCYDGPSTSTHCNVFAESPKTHFKDSDGYDTWDKIAGLQLSAYFARPQDTTKGAPVIKADLSKNSLYLDSVISQSSYLKDGELAIRPYWKYRESSGTGTHHSHQYGGSQYQEDGKYQAAYVEKPILNWGHPSLRVNTRIQDSLNYLNLKTLYADVESWDGLNSSGDSIHAGFKRGIRGMAYRPTLNMERLNNVWGKTIPQQRYIRNFYQRSGEQAHVRWKGNPGKDDDLQFHPLLDVSDSMFKVTWDTVWAPFPMGVKEFDKSQYLELDSTGVVLAYDGGEGLSYQEFTQDTSKYPLLRSRILASEATGRGLYVDSVDVNLAPLFPKLLNNTDTANVDRLYHYIISDSNYLKFNLELIPYYYKNISAGELLTESDTGKAYHTVKIIRNTKQILARIFYLNVPKHDSSWTAEDDPGLKKTAGYLYGQGTFNGKEDVFHGRGNALDASGFLGFVNAATLDLDSSSSPDSRRPFYVNSTGTVAWNPNVDPNGFGWDMDLFYADGATINADLDTLGADRSNFTLGLALKQGSRSFSPIYGTLPKSITNQGQSYLFVGYRLWAINKSDALSSPIQVNKFYSRQQTKSYYADVYPEVGLDFWNTKETPVLGYWEQTRLNGAYEIVLVADYKDEKTGVIRSVVSRQSAQAGYEYSDKDTLLKVTTPYNRATLVLEAPAISKGDVVSLHMVSVSDLQDELPDVLPVGPVVEIKTTGSNQFAAPHMPQLVFRLTSREVFADKGWNIDDEQLTRDSLVKALDKIKSDYRIYLYGESGTVDPVSTLAAVQIGEDKEGTYLQLTADVKHFSLAMVLKDTAHAGALPRIESVVKEGDSLLVSGFYRSDMDGDRVWFADSVPTDLELLLRTKSLRDTTGVNLLVKKMSLDVYGRFYTRLALKDIPEPGAYVVAHYLGSAQGDRKWVDNSSSAIWLDSLIALPDPILPSCGNFIQTISFKTSHDSLNGRWFVLDSLGRVLEDKTFTTDSRKSRLSWDGCAQEMPLALGRYLHAVWLDSGRVRDTLAVTLGSKVLPGLSSAGVKYNVFHPSDSDKDHQQQIWFYAPGWEASDLQVVILGTQISDTLTVKAGAQRGWWNAFWNGTHAKDGMYKAVISLPGHVGLSRSVHFEVKHLAKPVVTLGLNPTSWSFPQYNAGVVVNTNRALKGKIWLERADGSRLWLSGGDSDSEWSTIGAGENTLRFDLKDSAQALPTTAVLRYVTSEGIAGLLSIPVSMVLGQPKIRDFRVLPDTIYPDFVASANPRVAVVSYVLDEKAPVALEVRQRGKVLYRVEKISAQGAQSILWTGIQQDSSLVPEGSYQLVLRAMPQHSADVEKDVASGVVQVQRLPQVAVCACASTDDSVRASQLAESIRTRLLSRGLHSVHIMDSDGVAEYMGLLPDGVVVFAGGRAPENLFGKNRPGNPLHRFISTGGKVAFLGGMPVGFEAIPLYGLADPYTPETTLVKWSEKLFSLDFSQAIHT